MGLVDDIRTVAVVTAAHRGWLDRHELELLRAFEKQVHTGWCLSRSQRQLVDDLAMRAEQRRDVAMSLNDHVN